MNQAVLVERVVAEVMKRLMTAPASRNEDGKGNKHTATLMDAVITEGLLAEKAKSLRQLEVGAKSIVTPAAKDWLLRNNIEWRRVALSSRLPVRQATQLIIAATQAGSAKQAVNEIQRVRSAEWSSQSCQANEAAAVAVKGIATDGITKVVILADEAEVVACQANRNELVRAAVVASVGDIERVQKTLKPNVFLIAPDSKGAFEIIRMVRVLG